MRGAAPERTRRECLIHCPYEDQNASLIAPKDINSWKSLLRAAEIRQHAPILHIAKDLPDDIIPPVTYHRKCRSIFTMKKDVDAIIAKQKTKESDKESRKSARQALSGTRVYQAKCIFCEKSSKFLQTRDTLTQSAELRVDDKIRKAAASKLDYRKLAIVSRELMAAEGHYHRSCHRLYTKDVDSMPAGNAEETDSTDDTDAQHQAAEKQSYRELFSYIREELFADHVLIHMIDLADRVVQSMAVHGVNDVKPSTKKHIRRKLEAEFGDALHIIPDDKGKLLVYPDNLSVPELVKAYHVLQSKILILESDRNESVIDKAALQMRGDVKKKEYKQTWPPQISDEKTRKDIPPSMTKFLHTLLTGTLGRANASNRVQKLCSSFDQDHVYDITGGRTRPMKHIVLPFAVK